MIPENVKKVLKKQHYEIVGKHSAVQICRWTKKSLKNEEVCYKEKFYGIKSHLCCQMTPSVMWCPNKCLHCWRAIELTLGHKLKNKEIDSAKKIIDESIKAQRKLIIGFKGNSKVNKEKFEQALEPMQFAISLSGEPMIYPYISDLIDELRKRGKTSFLVTNGLYPEKIKELIKKNSLPTQLYVSVNSSNKEEYKRFHRSVFKNAWEKLNTTLSLFPILNKKTRTIFRMNLIKDLNMNEKNIKEFAQMIKKYKPMFIEIKAYMSVGFARQRLGYDKMPREKEMNDFIQKLIKELKGTGYKLLDKHLLSRAYVLGKNKKNLKITKI